ncbi:MAG: GTP cyclohydrolase II [Paraglaciecola sp.]
MQVFVAATLVVRLLLHLSSLATKVAATINPYFNSMKRQVEATMPTDWGTFRMIAYAESETEKMPHLAMAHEGMDTSKTVLVRMHSECMTGDLFHSQRCDCGEQLDEAMRLVAEQNGMVIYLRQEGRGIGIINKLHAYNLQDKGLDTVDANVALGLEVDSRDYQVAVKIMRDLGIKKIHLLTNNPLKIQAIDNSSVEVVSRIPLIIPAKDGNRNYLKTKEKQMGHLFNV